MNARDLLAGLERDGFTLWIEGGALKYKASRTPIDPVRLANLRTHKTTLMGMLSARVFATAPVSAQNGPGPLAHLSIKLHAEVARLHGQAVADHLLDLAAASTRAALAREPVARLAAENEYWAAWLSIGSGELPAGLAPAHVGGANQLRTSTDEIPENHNTEPFASGTQSGTHPTLQTGHAYQADGPPARMLDAETSPETSAILARVGGADQPSADLPGADHPQTPFYKAAKTLTPTSPGPWSERVVPIANPTIDDPIKHLRDRSYPPELAEVLQKIAAVWKSAAWTTTTRVDGKDQATTKHATSQAQEFSRLVHAWETDRPADLAGWLANQTAGYCVTPKAAGDRHPKPQPEAWPADIVPLIDDLAAIRIEDPPLGFTLRPGVSVTDPAIFLDNLKAEVAMGPRGLRGRLGLVRRDIEDLVRVVETWPAAALPGVVVDVQAEEVGLDPAAHLATLGGHAGASERFGPDFGLRLWDSARLWQRDQETPRAERWAEQYSLIWARCAEARGNDAI